MMNSIFFYFLKVVGLLATIYLSVTSCVPLHNNNDYNTQKNHN